MQAGRLVASLFPQQGGGSTQAASQPGHWTQQLDLYHINKFRQASLDRLVVALAGRLEYRHLGVMYCLTIHDPIIHIIILPII
jgi:hypothetical protein